MSPFRVHSGDGEFEKGLRDALRGRQPCRVLAREDLRAQPGAHDAGIEQIDPHRGAGDLAGIAPHQGLKAGLGDRVGP